MMFLHLRLRRLLSEGFRGVAVFACISRTAKASFEAFAACSDVLHEDALIQRGLAFLGSRAF